MLTVSLGGGIVILILLYILYFLNLSFYHFCVKSESVKGKEP